MHALSNFDTSSDKLSTLDKTVNACIKVEAKRPRQKRPITEAKETYYRGKGRETYYRGKRDLLRDVSLALPLNQGFE
jgi:hypothetical protein